MKKPGFYLGFFILKLYICNQQKTNIKMGNDLKIVGIEGVEFLTIELVFDSPINRIDYDLGSLTLSCDGRSFIVDVVQTYTNEDKTMIVCDVAVDLDTFPHGNGEFECTYDITSVDFINSNLIATLYVGGEHGDEPDYINLFVKIGGMTVTIEVTQD